MDHDNLFLKKIKNKFNATDAALVSEAYAFSKERIGDCRSSAFQAAKMLMDQDADAITVAAALIAPLLWNNRATIDDIFGHFNPIVAETLRDFSPQSILRTDTQRYCREDIHTFLVSLDGLPRKAVLIITFRLLELENALESPKVDTRQMAQETLDFYVPIANRLSLGDLRRRLEDACFQILDPTGYVTLKNEITPIQADDDNCLEMLLIEIQHMLNKNDIQGRIQIRTKSLYSIFRKMERTGKTLEEIIDRIGLRIIVSSVPECYSVLGLLHTHFKPIPGTFDDYIGLSKNNGYQSIHTSVYPLREITHKPIEFQVRTEFMHVEAEYGAAAHWRYKSETETAQKDRIQAQWIEGLVRRHEKAKTAEAFIQLLHRQVYENHLVVFGKGGRILRLPENSTVMDYLDRNNICITESSIVKVNGKISDTNRSLRDGDSIEILGQRDQIDGKPNTNPAQAKL